MKNKATRIIAAAAALCLIAALALAVSQADLKKILPKSIDFEDYLDVCLFLGESGQYYNYGYEVSSHAVPYDAPAIESLEVLNFDSLRHNLEALGTDESAEVELMKPPRFSKGISSIGITETLAITHDRHDEIIEVMKEYPAEILIILSDKNSYRYTVKPVIIEPELEQQDRPETANGVVEKTARRFELFHSYDDTGSDFTEDPAYEIVLDEIERIKPESDSSAVTPELMDVYYIDNGGLINQNGESISVYEANVRYHADPIPANAPEGYHLRGDCLWPDDKTYIFVYEGPMYMARKIPVRTMSASELRKEYFTKEHMLEHGNRFEAAAWELYEQYFNGAWDAKTSLYVPVQYSRAIGPNSKDDFRSIPNLGKRIVTVHEDWEPVYDPGDYWYTVDYDGLTADCYYTASDNTGRINSLTVSRPDLVTYNGLHVGSTRAEVLQASDPKFTHDTELYPYTGDCLWINYMSEDGLGCNLIFFFENDIVTKIISVNLLD